MKNKEVVEILQYYIINMEAAYECKNDIEAFEHAIKCVELMPELVANLEEAREFLVDADDEGYYYWEDEINKYGELINKAKELIE